MEKYINLHESMSPIIIFTIRIHVAQQQHTYVSVITYMVSLKTDGDVP